MRNFLTLGLFLLLFSCNNNKEKKETKKTDEQAQKDNSQASGADNFGLAALSMDPALKARMNEYFRLTMNLELEKLMDYVYPKIFEQASREQMIKEIKGSFENEDMKAQIDSIHVDKLSAPFTAEGGEYAKVYYSMNMVFDFKSDLEQDKKIFEQMAAKFGKENVTMDPQTGVISVWQSDSMVAAKDKISKDWTFISAKEEMVDAIFSDAVLDKLDQLE